MHSVDVPGGREKERAKKTSTLNTCEETRQNTTQIHLLHSRQSVLHFVQLSSRHFFCLFLLSFCNCILTHFNQKSIHFQLTTADQSSKFCTNSLTFHKCEQEHTVFSLTSPEFIELPFFSSLFLSFSLSPRALTALSLCVGALLSSAQLSAQRATHLQRKGKECEAWAKWPQPRWVYTWHHQPFCGRREREMRSE